MSEQRQKHWVQPMPKQLLHWSYWQISHERAEYITADGATKSNTNDPECVAQNVCQLRMWIRVVYSCPTLKQILALKHLALSWFTLRFRRPHFNPQFSWFQQCVCRQSWGSNTSRTTRNLQLRVFLPASNDCGYYGYQISKASWYLLPLHAG